MAVDTVKIEADAYMVCLTHALSTEREEVMGLLIGEVQYLFTRFIWKILGDLEGKTCVSFLPLALLIKNAHHMSSDPIGFQTSKTLTTHKLTIGISAVMQRTKIIN